MVAPESARLAPLLAAVTVPPAQVVAPEAEAVFTRPAGYVSVNVAPVTGEAFGLVSVIVITLVSPVPIAAGAKALAMFNADNTDKDALPAAVLAPAFAVASAPAAMELA